MLPMRVLIGAWAGMPVSLPRPLTGRRAIGGGKGVGRWDCKRIVGAGTGGSRPVVPAALSSGGPGGEAAAAGVGGEASGITSTPDQSWLEERKQKSRDKASALEVRHPTTPHFPCLALPPLALRMQGGRTVTIAGGAASAPPGGRARGACEPQVRIERRGRGPRLRVRTPPPPPASRPPPTP